VLKTCSKQRKKFAMNLLSLTSDQLVDQFRRRYARGSFHAAALYRAFYGSTHWELAELPEFADAPELRRLIQRDLALDRPSIVAESSEDGVSKLVFQLGDGRTIETVVIPMANHATVCISCQVGCRMGCRFCQTGQMGLIRHLNVDEIVAQVYAVKVELGIKVRNVVLMGMGEPLDNFDPVVQAIRVMADQRGLDIAKRHITVSTAGLAPKIEQLAALNWPRLKLAISLNASNDTLRSQLMPVNRKYPMGALKSALRNYPLARGNVIFFEYVLIKGVNDHSRYARQLCAYFRDLPIKLNLIPFNPTQPSPFKAPTVKDVDHFHQALIEQNIFVRLRSPKGAGIRAACGQLGAKTMVHGS
jgi:23S rRNA (adenine2503-C2)-methyltransferase